MLYDLAQAPPEQGSLLESVFLVLTKRRQEQEFLKARVMVEATLAPHLEGKSKISDTFNDYMNAMFPYLAQQKSTQEDEMHQTLKKWTAGRAFKIKPLWEAKERPARFKSSLVRGRQKVEERERLRKEGKAKKI